MTLKTHLDYVRQTYQGYKQGKYSLEELKNVGKQYVSLHPIAIGTAAIAIMAFVHSCNYSAFNAAGVHYQFYPGQHRAQVEHKFDRLREIKVEAASNAKKAVEDLDDILDWLEDHQQVQTADIVYKQTDTAIDEVIEKYHPEDTARKTRALMHIMQKDSK